MAFFERCQRLPSCARNDSILSTTSTSTISLPLNAKEFVKELRVPQSLQLSSTTGFEERTNAVQSDGANFDVFKRNYTFSESYSPKTTHILPEGPISVQSTAKEVAQKGGNIKRRVEEKNRRELDSVRQHKISKTTTAMKRTQNSPLTSRDRQSRTPRTPRTPSSTRKCRQGREQEKLSYAFGSSTPRKLMYW